MKFVTLSAALAAAVSAVHGLTINTPASVVACEPTQFTWDGGSAPYYLSLVPGGQPTASPIKQFPNQDGTSYTWLVDLQAGTIFNIALKDSTGATSYSDIITIQSGSSTSCLNTAVEEGSSTSGSSATGTSGSGSGAAATTSATGTNASASATATSSSGAGKYGISSAFGVAAVMGFVGATLF